MLTPGPLVAALAGVRPATLRKWTQRGHVQRRGTGPSGVALYDLDEVLAHARSAGGGSATPEEGGSCTDVIHASH